MARFNLLLSLYLAVYLRKVTAGYNQWSDLPVCAHTCFQYAVNNMISPCNYDLSCVCGSNQTDLLNTVTACFSTQSGTPCLNDTVAEDIISYGQNVFCDASDENAVVFDVVSGHNTSTLALDTPAGQAEWTTTHTLTSAASAAANASGTQSHLIQSSAATTTTEGSPTTSSAGSSSTADPATTSSLIPSTTAANPPGATTSYSTVVVTMNTSSLASASTESGAATTVTASASPTTWTSGDAGSSKSEAARGLVERACDILSLAGLLVVIAAAGVML